MLSHSLTTTVTPLHPLKSKGVGVITMAFYAVTLRNACKGVTPVFMITSSSSSRTSSGICRTSSKVPNPLRIGTGTGRLELVLASTFWAQYMERVMPLYTEQRHEVPADVAKCLLAINNGGDHE